MTGALIVTAALLWVMVLGVMVYRAEHHNEPPPKAADGFGVPTLIVIVCICVGYAAEHFVRWVAQ